MGRAEGGDPSKNVWAVVANVAQQPPAGASANVQKTDKKPKLNAGEKLDQISGTLRDQRLKRSFFEGAHFGTGEDVDQVFLKSKCACFAQSIFPKI